MTIREDHADRPISDLYEAIEAHIARHRVWSLHRRMQAYPALAARPVAQWSALSYATFLDEVRRQHYATLADCTATTYAEWQTALAQAAHCEACLMLIVPRPEDDGVPS